ncbi:hypothetical protein HDU98_008624 [Podochytrium sp. JEL0797]|nr:hypothetical protein HDU98_008624 [Podochytrium sp. JEL0797]
MDLIAFLIVLCATIVSAGYVTQCSNITQSVPADFLFLIDGSSSMCLYNQQIAANLALFVDQINAKNISARYSVIGFGGQPSILLPFTSSAVDAKAALLAVGCSRSGWEAGMEAIRMTLNPNNGSDMIKACTGSYTSACSLIWRNGNVQKQIIMATDEDSDIPTSNTYMMPAQGNALCPSGYNNGISSSCSGIEPPFQPRQFYGKNFYRNSSVPIVLEDPYYTEIVVTANLIVSTGASISLLMQSTFNANTAGPQSTFDTYNQLYKDVYPTATQNHAHTAIVQYGDPLLQSQSSTFGEFSASATYLNLETNQLQTSLQAQVLRKNGMMRLYMIQDIINPTIGPSILQNMYTAITNRIVNCTDVYVTDSTHNDNFNFYYILFNHLNQLNDQHHIIDFVHEHHVFHIDEYSHYEHFKQHKFDNHFQHVVNHHDCNHHDVIYFDIHSDNYLNQHQFDNDRNNHFQHYFNQQHQLDNVRNDEHFHDVFYVNEYSHHEHFEQHKLDNKFHHFNEHQLLEQYFDVYNFKQHDELDDVFYFNQQLLDQYFNVHNFKQHEELDDVFYFNVYPHSCHFFYDNEHE